MPLISILIPTKDYSDGLIRLLEYLPKNKSYLNIIISDDFSNSEIKNYVKKLKFTNLIYSKNIKNFGVAYNWNKLLKECNSKYFMFIHHDDYISDASFFFKLFKLIKKNKNLDMISIDTKIIRSDKNEKQWHIHYQLRRFLNLISNKYILKRNFLGPLSSLIIKNIDAPLFDDKLKWLIDVDFYYRIMLNKKIIFTNKLIINSEANHKFSITYSIKNKIKKINSEEWNYLKQKYDFTKLNKFLFFFEPLFWILVRMLNLILKR